MAVAVEVRGLGAHRESLATARELRYLCRRAAAAAGVHEGHMAVEFVSSNAIAELNRRFRGEAHATDVLSFPLDGTATLAAGLERELGDVMVCASHCSDVREAVVHGTLHLLGFDHETDRGEMLALQRELLAGERA